MPLLTSFLNAKRLRDYPRLIFAAVLIATAANLLTRNGWQDAAGNIFGNDFLMMYAGGVIYNTQPAMLFDFGYHAGVQASLVAPAPMYGAIPYNYPPYMAAFMGLVTRMLPLSSAFIILTLLSVALTAAGAAWAQQVLAPDWLKKAGLSATQMAILVLSCFPFIEGLKVGQNHGLTFFLAAGIVIATLSGRSFLAGALAALTAYKPQFALGFLLLWLIWRDYKAILGYGVVAGIWGGLTLLQSGWGMYQAYIDYLPVMLKMPYIENYATYLMMTPYGLLLTLFPQKDWQGIMMFSNLLTVFCTLALGWYAFTLRNDPLKKRSPALAMALLYPILATPQVLLHDSLTLALFFLIWTQTERSRRLLYTAIVVYLGSFLLAPISRAIHIPLMAFVPPVLAIFYIQNLWQVQRASKEADPHD